MIAINTLRRIHMSVLTLMIGLPLLAQADAPPSGNDMVAPNINHQLQTRGRVEAGNPVEITAVVRDDDGVAAVTLYYRNIGGEEYTRLPMQLRDLDLYGVTIPGAQVSAPGIEYYIQAEDKVGNLSFKGATFSPIQLAIKGGPPGSAVVAVSGMDEKHGSDSNNDDSPFAGNRKWYWVAGGVLLTGAIYASSQGGEKDKGSGDTTVTISGKVPQ